MAETTVPVIDGGRWLTMAAARRLLGVNDSTLRRWADAGQIRSFRTPGGHRRFSEADLRALVAGVSGRRGGNRYTGMGPLAVNRIRRQLQHPGEAPPAWALGIDPASRERLRQTGRRLVALTTEYLGARRGRARLVEEAQAIGREYGVEMARSGLSLRDTVTAFTFFRRSLEDAAKQYGQRQHLSTEETAQSWELINSIGDEVLIALTEAYETSQRRRDRT